MCVETSYVTKELSEVVKVVLFCHVVMMFKARLCYLFPRGNNVVSRLQKGCYSSIWSKYCQVVAKQ